MQHGKPQCVIKDDQPVAREGQAGRTGVAGRLVGKSIPEKADNGDRRLGSGDAAAIATNLRALRDLGVIAVDFGFSGVTADAVVADMRQLRETVLATVWFAQQVSSPDWRISQPPGLSGCAQPNPARLPDNSAVRDHFCQNHFLHSASRRVWLIPTSSSVRSSRRRRDRLVCDRRLHRLIRAMIGSARAVNAG